VLGLQGVSQKQLCIFSLMSVFGPIFRVSMIRISFLSCFSALHHVLLIRGFIESSAQITYFPFCRFNSNRVLRNFELSSTSNTIIIAKLLVSIPGCNAAKNNCLSLDVVRPTLQPTWPCLNAYSVQIYVTSRKSASKEKRWQTFEAYYNG
jgi:hypothetical protein